MKKKINIYFNEYNLLMGSGGVSYLPFVSGILSANAKTSNGIFLAQYELEINEYTRLISRSSKFVEILNPFN